jgi:hypothetical protein
VLDPTNPDDAELDALFETAFAELRAREAERERWARLNVSGVYVYTLGHYLAHSFTPTGERC